MKKSSGGRSFVFFSIVEIILLLMSLAIVYMNMFTSARHFDWLSLGGTLRDWYWYENFIYVLSFLLPLVVLVNGIELYVKVKRKVRVGAGFATFLALVGAVIVWNYSVFAGFLVAVVFGIALCIVGICFRRRILRFQ